MSAQRDYYEILGVSKTASTDEIKKVYRKLVMEFHPDRVAPDQKKAAEEKFKEISEAYAVLSDEKKRSLYDKYGHAGIDSRYSQEDIFRGADFSDIFKNFGGGGSIFEDLFSDLGFDIFGAGSAARGRRGSRRGEDIQLELPISLEEAYSGAEKEVAFNHYELCGVCSGSGAQPGSRRETCPTCRGRGMVTSGMGFISFAQTCPVCHGERVIVKSKCNKCGGEGRVKARKSIKVNIPAGVDTGSVLRLRGEGNHAFEQKGDLYLHINVKNHHVFGRQDSDIRCKVAISVLQAILGAEIEVPTLSGKVAMKIPAGTQPNSVFRLKGKGMPDLRSKRNGDELVEVEVEIPERLSAKERGLFGEIAKLRGDNIS